MGFRRSQVRILSPRLERPTVTTVMAGLFFAPRIGECARNDSSEDSSATFLLEANANKFLLRKAVGTGATGKLRLPMAPTPSATGTNRVRSGPVSRVLYHRRNDDGDGHFSGRTIARPLKRSTRKSIAGRTSPRERPSELNRPAAIRFFLLDLAPSGVCLAKPVTRPAGELLPHRFTLTARVYPAFLAGRRSMSRKIREAVCFLLHFPWPFGRWALPTTLSYGARTFLRPFAA